jgi:hypothetical protein
MQCWDALGRLTVDLSTRLPRVLGFRSINSAGSLTDNNLSAGTPFFIFQQAGVFYHISGDTALPTITISGNTISWTYSGAQTSHHTNVPGTIFYGVY